MRMHEHFHFRGHLCIVFELLSVSLYELIQGNGFRGFGLATVKRAPPPAASQLPALLVRGPSAHAAGACAALPLPYHCQQARRTAHRVPFDQSASASLRQCRHMSIA